YRPPPARASQAGLALAPDSLGAIRERFADPADFLALFSPPLARDLRAGGGSPVEAWTRLESIARSAASGSWAPVVYSRRPLAEIGDAEPIGRDDLVVSPLPLRAGLPGPPGPIVATPFTSPSEAVEAGFSLLERTRDFQAGREKHLAIVRREIERLLTLTGKLEVERTRAGESERHRRHAEALLAGVGRAELAGRIARLPDPYGEPGALLEVPIDPALSLQQNAQVCFDRYKKGKRGRIAIATRLAAVTERLEAWRRLIPQAERVGAWSDLEELRGEMDRLGLVHAPPPRTRGASPRRGETAPARVRRHTSRDGLVILIGKSGEENDTLTFKIAAPWDFWLHAAGRPGAHVVVRNPQRLKQLPDATLREAAGLAAFYSGGRAEGRVEVHYTQRKHLHKPRGMARGQVLLRRFRSIEVGPALPASTLEDV
ncbi:MAG TPA: NFACT RNA binding domain-containing protein, partial [Candidatus Polarisedimenticolia bacterium]